jgi:hypothetical protein
LIIKDHVNSPDTDAYTNLVDAIRIYLNKHTTKPWDKAVMCEFSIALFKEGDTLHVGYPMITYRDRYMEKVI